MRPCDASAAAADGQQAAADAATTDDQEELLLRRMVAHACAWVFVGRGPEQQRLPVLAHANASVRPPFTAFASVAHLARSPTWLAQLMTAAGLSGVGHRALELPGFNVSRPISQARATPAAGRKDAARTHDAASRLMQLDGCVVSADGAWNAPRCAAGAAELCKVEIM